jgi:hypothetical protein
MDFPPEQFLAIREKQSEAFHLALRGYRVKEFLTDPIERNSTMDARCRRSSPTTIPLLSKNRLPEPESSQRPCLVAN